MKIAMICYPTHGGSGVVATELGINLARRGHQVHFISYSSPFRLRDWHQNVFFHEVDVSVYPLFKYPPYSMSLAAKIMEVTKEFDLDIIHAHYAIPHAVSAYLARQMLGDYSPGIITTLHGTDITLVGRDSSFYEAVKFSIDESDGVTAVSQYLAQRTCEEFSISKEIRVIPNFVDTNRYNGTIEECSASHFAPEGQKLLIHTSNFRPVKRLQDTIKILAEVRKVLPARLLLVGEGPDRQITHDLADKLGVLEDVIFLGTQDYMDKVLGCADLFLLPSEEESFGLAALEAMACRTPVIGSKIGGIPEVVDHDINGLLYPVGDYRAMSRGAIALLSDENRIERYKNSARQKAIDKFDLNNVIPVYEAFYREILSR